MNDPTKKYYVQNALTYAKRNLQIPTKELYVAFSAFLQPSARVLDIGCGAGRDLKELSQRGFCVLGVDYSTRLAKIARAYSKQDVIVADIRSLNLLEGEFDGIWAVASLFHIPRSEISQVLRQLYRFLRSGGVLLTSMQEGEGHEIAQDGRHFELYLPKEWETLLRTIGFKILQCQEGTRRDETGRGEIIWFVTISRK